MHEADAAVVHVGLKAEEYAQTVQDYHGLVVGEDGPQIVKDVAFDRVKLAPLDLPFHSFDDLVKADVARSVLLQLGLDPLELFLE